MTTGPDRLKYFRLEARELLDGLQEGVLKLEAEGADPALEERLFRQAHTLKGAARIVGLAPVAERAHALEDALQALRDGGSPAGCLEVLDALAADLRAVLNEPTAPAAGEGPPAIADGFAAGRIDPAALEPLWEASLEAGVQLDALRGAGAELERLERLASSLTGQLTGTSHASAESLRRALDRLRHRLEGGLDRATAEVVEVQDHVRNLRLVPASAVVPQLERACRDAATSLGRRVGFAVSGGDTRLDGLVLSGVREALLHVVTNAVTHGLESEPERVAVGKPAVGQVGLQVERRGDRIAFTCRDDGRGIDPEAVRAVAIERRVLSPQDAERLPAEDVIQLIFKGGVTTRGAVSALSGRGVGLDVVRTIADRLKGEVRALSRPGHGTTIELVVPLTLTSVSALMLEAGGRTVSLPLEAVTGAVRVQASQLVGSGGTPRVVVGDRELPFVSLARLLGAPEPVRAWSAVVVRTGSGELVVGAEHLRGRAELVVSPLPALLGPLPLFSGASLDGEGHPVPMLDPRGLTPQAVLTPEPVRERRPLLVIDDSLTTRMLEQTILQSAGYEVDLAASAEEGLAKARQRPYGLFLVDVEMPGMDGFGFLETIRADRQLQDVPAVLITSRHAPADQRRGAEAGARAYIVKSEFDQERFLEIVRGLAL